MMATKQPDGNERLDAHLHNEFVKEPVFMKRSTKARLRGRSGRTDNLPLADQETE